MSIMLNEEQRKIVEYCNSKNIRYAWSYYNDSLEIIKDNYANPYQTKCFKVATLKEAKQIIKDNDIFDNRG